MIERFDLKTANIKNELHREMEKLEINLKKEKAMLQNQILERDKMIQDQKVQTSQDLKKMKYTMYEQFRQEIHIIRRAAATELKE